MQERRFDPGYKIKSPAGILFRFGTFAIHDLAEDTFTFRGTRGNSVLTGQLRLQLKDIQIADGYLEICLLVRVLKKYQDPASDACQIGLGFRVKRTKCAGVARRKRV